ncbi:hypothetical protein GCM10010349_45240 [Streptomyces flavofungini]|nr:hypothetical protein GCM10010349_45240 [Streptomyces flavofungini]
MLGGADDASVDARRDQSGHEGDDHAEADVPAGDRGRRREATGLRLLREGTVRLLRLLTVGLLRLLRVAVAGLLAVRLLRLAVRLSALTWRWRLRHLFSPWDTSALVCGK